MLDFPSNGCLFWLYFHKLYEKCHERPMCDWRPIFSVVWCSPHFLAHFKIHIFILIIDSWLWIIIKAENCNQQKNFTSVFVHNKHFTEIQRGRVAFYTYILTRACTVDVRNIATTNSTDLFVLISVFASNYSNSMVWKKINYLHGFYCILDDVARL